MTSKKVKRNMEVSENKLDNVSYVNVDLNSYICATGGMIVVSGGNLSTSDNPIGILTEKNTNVDKNRRAMHINMKGPRERNISGNIVKVQLCNNALAANADSGESKVTNTPTKQKIPRPPNAFMLFANEWRKKLATENPRESNKDISVRL